MARNKTDIITLVCILLFISELCIAQSGGSLGVDSCYAMAQRNYPLVKQYALIEKSKEYSLDNASKGTLPQFNIAGQATYQSAVTKVPIDIPNVRIIDISKDQYKLYGEVSQPITDLFTVKDQKLVIASNAAVEGQKIEVELFKLKERINQLFFGVLLLDAQVQQNELLKKDILTGIDKTTGAIANGIALRSSADILKAELLKANQKTVELKATRKGYTDMLSLFINQPVDETVVFEKPSTLTLASDINRPELKLYDLQKTIFDAQDKLITAKNLPRFSLFFQGGMGRPALNMLSNDLTGYYIGGLRLNWNLSGFYTAEKEREILVINKNQLDVQRQTFIFNTNLTMKQQTSEVVKLQELIQTDSDIIDLRERIKNTAKGQLEFGTATTNDYLTYINAEDLARQNRVLHEVQLLMAQYNYQTTTGN